MSSRPNERVSSELSGEELRAAILALPTVLKELVGNCILVATYGHGSYLHPDLCYTPMKVGTSWLDRFVHDSLDQRIIVPGKSDFSFVVPEGRLEIEFCHDGHIHVSGSDTELLGRLLAKPQFTSVNRRGSSKADDA